jgi:hypothetical protein
MNLKIAKETLELLDKELVDEEFIKQLENLGFTVNKHAGVLSYKNRYICDCKVGYPGCTKSDVCYDVNKFLTKIIDNHETHEKYVKNFFDKQLSGEYFMDISIRH